MKIAFNPSTVAALTSPPNNKDITFDLKGHNIFARGVKFYGTDTNTWRDIKVNNVSIGSNILDLRNGSNTTLTNTNGVVTINSTWRPVVDSLTSDSTTSSLSAKQGKVLKALIDGKSNSGHTHDDRYLKLTGGTMASNALITFADSGSWGTDKGPQGARGGLQWSGQSDYAKLYAEETAGDNLDLVIQFGNDNSNGLSIRNKTNTQTSYISASGVITTGTFKGNLDWSYITNKPATATRWPSWEEVTGKPGTFTPAVHTHGLFNSVFFLNMPNISGNAKWKEALGYPVNSNLLLSVRINSPAPDWCVGNYGSGILYGGSNTKGFMSSAYNEPFIMWAGGNGSSEDSVPKWYIGIKGTHKSIYNLTTIALEANTAYNLRHSHSNKSVLDGITSALVNSWNTAYNFVNNITKTDTDKVINKWDEIVNFLAEIDSNNKLNTLLNSKLSIQQLAANNILTTKTNNALFWVNTVGTAGNIPTGPFTDHPYALLSVTNYSQNDTNGKFFYRSRLAFSSIGDIKVASCHHQNEYKQDETWYNVLTSKNSGISGSTIKLNGTSITVYSSGTADGRYVKKSGDTMTGALNFANGTWNKVGYDIYMGDYNIGGQLCLMGITGNTGISFHKQGDASIRKSITFNGSTLYMNGNCDYASLANQSNLLAMNTVPNKTTSTSVGSWSPISGRYVFHQRWRDTSTGGDGADFGIYLDGNLTANMVLDGYYNSLSGFRVIGAKGGFLKANGTIDNSTYLTSHQSLSNYYTKSEVDTKLNGKLNYRLFWERTNIDLNSITEAWHTYEVNDGTGTANTPTNAQWHQAVQWGTGDTDYAVQLCTAYTSNYSLYLRHKIASKWHNWIQLAATTDIPSSLKNPNAIKFKDTNGNVVTYDGSAAKDLTAGTYIAKLPYGFASFTSEATWGNTTGTSFASWNDSTGGSIDFRRDNPSAGKMSIKVDGRVYVNEGHNPVLSAESNNGFWGMRTPDGGNDWIRTPNNGLIPYISGNAGSGHSSLGTSSWYFSTAYIDKIYGSLKGNADTASSANKLTTARNIALGTDLRGSANFDGSGNITINANINACTVSVGRTDTLPFKRIAHFETGGSWNDNALLLYISEGYINGRNGICRVEFRTDNISSSSTSITASAAVRWLVRYGYGLDALYAGYYVTAGKAYIDIYLKTAGNYRGTVIRVLQDSRGDINSNVQLISSHYRSDSDHKEAYSSIEAASTSLYNRTYTKIVSGSDVGTVNYANSTGSVHWNNVTNKPSTFNPAAHTHTVFKNNLMIKGTNGISDSASIHLGIGDSDTGFKWISDGKCQIYANNVAIGEWTSGGMNWLKNPTVNGNKVWNAGNDGSGSGLDADTVDGYHANGLFTAFGNNGHNITATIGGVTKSFLVNYAADADKVDGYHVNTGQSPFGCVPTIGDNGVMEIGKYIDFHNDNEGKYDYSTRLQSTGNHQNTLNLPSKSGTLALTSDIKDTNTWRPISDDYEKGNRSISLSTLGSLTLYNDLLGSIPNPTNYYWANVKVSSNSSTTTSPTVNVLSATRVCAGHDPGISNSISCSNWFRSRGETGWYSSTYGGGWYMSDKDWIRSWGSKALYINNSIRSTNYQVMYGSTVASAAKLESTTTLVYGTDTSSNSINSYLRGTTVTLQVKKGASINYNALQLTDTYIYCNNYCDMKYGAAVGGGNLTVSTKAYIAQKGLLVRANDQIWYQQPVCIACGYVYDGPSNPGMVGSSERTQKVLCNQAASVTLIDGNGKYRVIFTNIIANKFNREKISLQLTGCPHGVDSRGVSDARGSVSSYGNALSIEVYTSDDNSFNPTSFYFALWTWE